MANGSPVYPTALSSTAAGKAEEEPQSIPASSLGIWTLTFLQTHPVSDRTSQR